MHPVAIAANMHIFIAIGSLLEYTYHALIRNESHNKTQMHKQCIILRSLSLCYKMLLIFHQVLTFKAGSKQLLLPNEIN